MVERWTISGNGRTPTVFLFKLALASLALCTSTQSLEAACQVLLLEIFIYFLRED